MRQANFWPRLSAAHAVLALTLLVSTASAQTETVLYSFGSQVIDGAYPYAGLLMDTAGNLYGTTSQGGANNYGTVFKLTPTGTETILHSFASNLTDGYYPWAGLIMKQGNLYGTTSKGGANGHGTVFALTRSGTTETVHSLTSGLNPYDALIKDTVGNLYGTTYYGGAHDAGEVFELTPSGTETTVYSFNNNGTDGVWPQAGLIRDSAGNLYGTTTSGAGASCPGGCGIVFKVTPSGIETVLHSFNKNGTDGYYPYGGLIMKGGSLYGTTYQGGANDRGTVFKLTLSGTETILHSFNYTDGAYPSAGLIKDTAGNLYGTTSRGGAYGDGTVFKLTPTGTETVLHSFNRSTTDGYTPQAPLIMDKNGNLYGTTTYGGALGLGVVFKITP